MEAIRMRWRLAASSLIVMVRVSSSTSGAGWNAWSLTTSRNVTGSGSCQEVDCQRCRKVIPAGMPGASAIAMPTARGSGR